MVTSYNYGSYAVLFIAGVNINGGAFKRLSLKMKFNKTIYMAAAFGLTVTHSIEPIFVHFFKWMWLYLGNGITNTGLRMLICVSIVVL